MLRTRSGILRLTVFVGGVLCVASATASAQGAVEGRASVSMNTARRDVDGGERWQDTELSTALTFRTPDADRDGLEAGLELRHSRYAGIERPQRLSIYEGFAGVRFGGEGQFRMRAGHLWISDLGTQGALAGGLFEYRQPASGDDSRLRVGIFTGLEPALYDVGYAPGVRKYGGYAALEQGYLRRHVVGYTRVRQGPLMERSVLSVTNFVPAGQRFFAYQAAEFDIEGPAGGTVPRGLAYFMANVRVTPATRVDVLGTYNRGHALDARRLTEDVLNGRPLSQQAVDGLRYESAGGRVTVEALPRTYVYVGYARDRNNRDDAPSGRMMLGGHAGDVFGSGLDVSASDSRVTRSGGTYHSRYASVGRGIGRSLYVSADYSTSLSVVRFLRSDGLVIETRPSTRRYSGTASATLTRTTSLLLTADYARDEGLSEFRVFTSLTYRLR